ncbi:trypco2 family protein [Streptomyces hesseae]|uniref:Trypco2 family protein n=1 Tax=Streptomyces hesseae TaxID=3075519 RepID=A0ABU2SHX7_9ACTN|nr:trypco2 family protein [Streptomyces sp. DSM 40473]MDT0448558.1 trypco2 family protein [Streptomyces sp. DSM 40473]
MEIELAAAVAALRDELTAAVARGSEQEIKFQVGPIELEFTVELRQDVKAKAGFKAWVVSGDGEAGLARSRTHRVTVALTPKGPDEDVWIHGRRSAPPGPGDVSGRIAD